MRHLFDRPLGASIAPCGSLFKYAYDPSSIISAGLNFAGTMATNQINAERAASDMATYLNLVRKQRDWQKEDQQWTEDYTKRLMDYQNQYNTPAAQMKRFKAAGLNPYALMNNEGAIGSGLSQSIPSPNPSTHGSVTPFQRPMLDNPMGSAADKIFGASSIKSQRIASLAEFSKALPDLVKAVGKDGAYRIASSFLGTNLDMSRLDDMIEIEYGRQSIAKKREDLALQIETLYGKDKAALIVQNLIFEGQSIVAEINKLYSEKRLNEQSVKELITRSAKNLAEKSNLDANTETVNQMRQFVVKSADMQASMDTYDKIEAETDFIQGTEARAWQRSPEGRMAAAAAQAVDDNGETNLVNKIVHGRGNARSRYRNRRSK